MNIKGVRWSVSLLVKVCVSNSFHSFHKSCYFFRQSRVLLITIRNNSSFIHSSILLSDNSFVLFMCLSEIVPQPELPQMLHLFLKPPLLAMARTIVVHSPSLQSVYVSLTQSQPVWSSHSLSTQTVASCGKDLKPVRHTGI